MSKYTTGELAKLCEISVRAVQFYDTKGLLKPAALTDGGRRLYSDDDLKKLRLICMLKFLGLTLDSIKGVLDSKTPSKVLLLLLDEQAKQIDNDIKDKQKQIKLVKVIRENIRNNDTIPINSINDIERMMNHKKKLRKTYAMMLIVSVLMTVTQITMIILWIIKGSWLPFAIGMPFVILAAILLVRMYYKNTLYICAECNTTFKPTLKKFFFAGHTPKTRKLKCQNCGHTGYCIEIASED